ncbi:MAG: hypothetical protein CVU03_10830 [Bacteroidetes bacterium HGW-Bacteroidetes-2]|jgi:hypothetical protein|nr:MAG: hypothetical protein CVU03_10830 [Bacteroidetes bacterium HGW-Bacteroidetes-2]
MIKYTGKFLTIFFFFSNLVNAQLSDLARVDFTYIPKGNSNVSYNRVRTLFNYPIKLKKERTYLFLGLDYSHIDFKMDENPSFDIQDLDDFQILDFNIGYITPLKNDWHIGVRLTPGFSSNLTANKLKLEDIVFSGDLVFIKDKTKDKTVSKPYRLILGITYSENRGYNFPLPYISYYRKFHSNWSYNLGIPKTNFQYHLSEKNRFKLYAELDGFSSNLQNGILVDNAKVSESINMSLILAGLEYEYHFTENILFYARTSYIISNTVNLRDKNRNNIKALDDANNYYLRTGFRFKI